MTKHKCPDMQQVVLDIFHITDLYNNAIASRLIWDLT